MYEESKMDSLGSGGAFAAALRSARSVQQGYGRSRAHLWRVGGRQGSHLQGRGRRKASLHDLRA